MSVTLIEDFFCINYFIRCTGRQQRRENGSERSSQLVPVSS